MIYCEFESYETQHDTFATMQFMHPTLTFYSEIISPQRMRNLCEIKRRSLIVPIFKGTNFCLVNSGSMPISYRLEQINNYHKFIAFQIGMKSQMFQYEYPKIFNNRISMCGLWIGGTNLLKICIYFTKQTIFVP